MTEWDGAIPRYLFRGFNHNSGGDSTLNTTTNIIPHAFHDRYVQYVCPDEAIRFSTDGKVLQTRYGRNPVCICGQSSIPHAPIRLAGMSRSRLIFEVHQNLNYREGLFPSHFSSWTADLNVAIYFATGARAGRYVGVLDTAGRQSHSTILHVPVLYSAGLIEEKDLYPFEYLVYGRVSGTAYTCMTLGSFWPSFPYSELKLLTGNTLTCLFGNRVSNNLLSLFYDPPAMQCCRVAKREKCYRHHATKAAYAWEPLEKDLSLFLTVVAAHWSYRCAPRSQEHELQSSHAPVIEQAVSELSRVIWTAARDPKVVIPLVNPCTYTHSLPILNFMITFLQRIQEEIVKVRRVPST